MEEIKKAKKWNYEKLGKLAEEIRRFTERESEQEHRYEMHRGRAEAEN